MNILLAGTKAVGLMSSSIAVVPGAVNNLSDALYEEVQSPVPDYAIPIAPGPDLID